jgi:hypothetical protein
MIRSISCFLTLLLAVTLTGCGSDGGLKVEYVEGVVTLDGEPLAESSVTFVPTSEGPTIETAMGMTDSKGVYKLSSMNGKPLAGAVAGEYKVLVTKIHAESLSQGTEYGAATGYSVNYKQTHLLPEVYRDFQDSPFSVTVKKGSNKGMNFDLKSAP